MKRWFAFLAVASAVSLSGACDDDEDDLCDAKCECEGCSEPAYDECLHSYDRSAREAEFRGCPDFYDAWVECQSATYYCDADFDWEDNCGPERNRLNDCLK